MITGHVIAAAGVASTIAAGTPDRRETPLGRPMVTRSVAT